MTYNEQKAAVIGEKYNISPITLGVWKTRGKIPDKYLKEEYKPRRVAETPKEKLDYQRGMKDLQSEKISVSELLKRAGVGKNVFADAVRSRVALDYNQFILLKKELQHLRIKVKALVEKLADKTRFAESEKREVDLLLQDKALVLASLFGYNHRKDKNISGTPIYTAYQRFSARRSKTSSLHEDWEVTLAIEKLSIFLIETSL